MSAVVLRLCVCVIEAMEQLSYFVLAENISPPFPDVFKIDYTP